MSWARPSVAVAGEGRSNVETRHGGDHESYVARPPGTAEDELAVGVARVSNSRRRYSGSWRSEAGRRERVTR